MGSLTTMYFFSPNLNLCCSASPTEQEKGGKQVAPSASIISISIISSMKSMLAKDDVGRYWHFQESRQNGGNLKSPKKFKDPCAQSAYSPYIIDQFLRLLIVIPPPHCHHLFPAYYSSIASPWLRLIQWCMWWSWNFRDTGPFINDVTLSKLTLAVGCYWGGGGGKVICTLVFANHYSKIQEYHLINGYRAACIQFFSIHGVRASTAHEKREESVRHRLHTDVGEKLDTCTLDTS